MNMTMGTNMKINMSTIMATNMTKDILTKNMTMGTNMMKDIRTKNTTMGIMTTDTTTSTEKIVITVTKSRLQNHPTLPMCPFRSGRRKRSLWEINWMRHRPRLVVVGIWNLQFQPPRRKMVMSTSMGMTTRRSMNTTMDTNMKINMNMTMGTNMKINMSTIMATNMTKDIPTKNMTMATNMMKDIRTKNTTMVIMTTDTTTST